MRQEINYSNLEGDGKKVKALKDIDNWFNEKKIYIEEIDRELRIQDLFFDGISHGFYSWRQFSFHFDFAGVQGYPAVVFWKEVKDSLHTMTQ